MRNRVSEEDHHARVTAPGGALAGWDLSPGKERLNTTQFGDTYGRVHATRADEWGTPNLYHGTNANLRPGDLITSGHQSNYPGVTNDVNAQHTFAAHDLTSAYHHAVNAVGQHVENYGSDAEDLGGGPNVMLRRGRYTPPQERRRVYQVEPTGRMIRDSEIEPEDHAQIPSFQSRQPLRVVRDVSSMAKNEWVAEQGEDVPHPNQDHSDVFDEHVDGGFPSHLNATQFGGR